MGKNNGDELVVKYGPLDATATDLANQAKKLEGDLEALKQMVASVADMWEGEAHETYKTQMHLWDKEARDIHQALVSIAHVVGRAGGDYRGGDMKAASYYL
ncbi:WXG100 family type VII secretion target [Streptomyces sp. NPDC050560]|uniref:WXG100 family type VII secretion target n=1 Tax=Streptomyces sp. NPDC050560 TaxID=3365630 RepID=UPI0037B1E985